MRNPIYYKAMSEVYESFYQMSISGMDEVRFDRVETKFHELLDAEDWVTLRLVWENVPYLVEMLQDDLYHNLGDIPNAWLTPEQRAKRDEALGGPE